MKDLEGVAFSNMTGSFSHISFHGNRYLFVLHSYNANVVLMECMKNQGDTELERVFQCC